MNCAHKSCKIDELYVVTNRMKVTLRIIVYQGKSKTEIKQANQQKMTTQLKILKDDGDGEY